MTKALSDAHYIDLAEVFGIQKGRCRKRLVGAVVVTAGGTEFFGANGFRQPSGGCLDGGCPRGVALSKAEPCIALHAEEAAVIAAGEAVVGSQVFVSHRPCDNCLRFMRAAGVSRVAFWFDGGIEVVEFLSMVQDV